MGIFFIGILLFIFGGIFSLIFKEHLKLKFVTIMSFFASILTIVPTLKLLFVEQAEGFLFTWNSIFGQVPFVIDGLSAFFIIVISFVSLLGTIYANGYMKHYLGKDKKFASHCFFLPLLVASMLMVTVVQNVFFFLIVWEMMSLSSFFLVIFEDDKKEVISAGIKYLVYMHISVIFIIAAFALMSINADSYNFADINRMFIENPHLKDLIFLLAFVGFGTKAGFIPMHNWLPDAHPAAPSHVSAIMSAVMIKTGIYGILRTLQIIDMPTHLIGYTVLFISMVTALYGIIYAVNQKDIKKLLAYSSVENIGLIGIAMSIIIFGQLYSNNIITTIGTVACFMHILNHSVFKSLLFMGAGSVYIKTHTRNMEVLGGLIKKMPYTALFFLFAGVAICAFPPLNGFISEFLMYSGLFYMLKINSPTLFIPTILTIATLALVGTLVILAMTKVYSITFLGKPRSDAAKNVLFDVPKSMLIPMGILSSLTVIIGILSPFAMLLVPSLMYAKNRVYAYEDVGVFNILFLVSAIVFVLFMILLIAVLVKNFKKRKSEQYVTWGCGYDKGNNHIQYTASSYAEPFTSILTPLFKKIFDVKKPKGLFPNEAHYASTVEDVEEAYIINPVLKFDEKFLSKFERLQDGNIQHYILYGLIFLILVLVGVVFLG